MRTSLSLRDSGVEVKVGLKEGSKSREKVHRGRASPWTPPAEVAKWADVIMLLRARHGAGGDLQERHRAEPRGGPTRCFFGHGLNIHFDLIKPAANVTIGMVAPKGPGHLVRRQFRRRQGRAPA